MEENYQECIDKACNLVRLLTEDFDKRYLNDAVVHSATLHIAQLYYMLTKVYHEEQGEMEFKTAQLLEGLNLYKENK